MKLKDCFYDIITHTLPVTNVSGPHDAHVSIHFLCRRPVWRTPQISFHLGSVHLSRLRVRHLDQLFGDASQRT